MQIFMTGLFVNTPLLPVLVHDNHASLIHNDTFLKLKCPDSVGGW